MERPRLRDGMEGLGGRDAVVIVGLEGYAVVSKRCLIDKELVRNEMQ